jgi:8-oxo-dGTP pyrophosphatase MutT (NUDIX family)
MRPYCIYRKGNEVAKKSVAKKQGVTAKVAELRKGVEISIETVFLDAINKQVADCHKKAEYRPTVVTIVVNADERFLLGFKATGECTFVQGGIHVGEDVIDAALRELDEEAQLRATKVVSYCGSEADDIRKKQYYYFLVSVKGIPRGKPKLDEIASLGWFSQKKLQSQIALLKGKYRAKRECMLRALKSAQSFVEMAVS